MTCAELNMQLKFFGDDAQKYGPFWTVIENQWSSLFHHPLYMAAYFLNPSYRYRPDFLLNPEVIRGLNECIARLEADNGKRISASIQVQKEKIQLQPHMLEL